MAFGDLKVQDLIYEDGSNNEITVVLSNLATKASPAFTGTVTGVNLTLSGDLQVNGTTTTINTTTLQVEDKNIEIGKVSSPSDTTADGGGWSLLGATTKTFNWVNATDAWTSSEHIHVGDNKKLLIGTGSDLQIWHNGNNSFIEDQGTGGLYISAADHLFLRRYASNETFVKCTGNGSVELYYDNVKKLNTRSDGVEVTALIVPGSTTTKITTNQLQFNRASGYSYIDQLGSSGALAFRTMHGGSETVRMLIEAGGNVNLPDNGHLTFGGSSDLQIRHNGSHAYITTITGNLLLQSASHIQLKPANGEDAIQAVANGGVELYYDNSKKLETDSLGTIITGRVLFGDSSGVNDHRIKFGDSGDLQIYHNGSSSVIDEVGSGSLKIQTNGTGVDIQKGTTETIARFIVDGAVQLYYDNSKKLETTASGVTVTGTVSDSKGDLRKIPITWQNSNTYTLLASDAGKVVSAATNGTNITVPASVFSGGDAITIMNHTGNIHTITQGSGVTMYNAADGSTGNRTLAQRGFCTLFYREHNVVYISGAGLS